MKYRIERTTQFKKDFKLAEKQGMTGTGISLPGSAVLSV